MLAGMSKHTPLKEREIHFIKRFNEKYPQFEYVSGYIHSDKPVLLKCKKCGYEFERNAEIIRHNKKLTCIHFVPISKGGTDEWCNIKLAHRICNTLKGNK